MKKQARKIQLSRETLRILDRTALRDVAGAVTRQNSCDTETLWACPTETRCGSSMTC